MLEAVRDGVIEGTEEQDEYVVRTLREINNLSDLVDDLFELSLIDVGALRLEMKPTPLQELVLESVEGMAAAAKKKGLDLSVQFEDGSTRYDRVQMLGRSSCAIPSPVSLTSTLTSLPASDADTVIEPSAGVCRIAFCTRFIKARRTRTPSTTTSPSPSSS